MIFFVALPFTHVMMIFLAATGLRIGTGAATSTGVGVGSGVATTVGVGVGVGLL